MKHKMKNRMKQSTPYVFLLPVLLVLNSCFGLNADITLNLNGSGTIALEYRIAKALDSLGKLDGNERWSTIPVGKADFERTLDRLPEMKLLSFSSREDAKDLIVDAKLQFATMQGLLAFMDASGRRMSYSGDAGGIAGSGRLSLTLNEGIKNTNANLAKLISSVTDGYSVRMSVSFPGQGNLAMSDSQGKALTAIPGSVINSSGKTVSFSIPLNQVLSSSGGINAVFSWGVGSRE